MHNFFIDNYLIFKSLHLIAVISWMAGLLYLPRLFVYHTEAPVGSEQDKIFQLMEKRLLRVIMNPAMVASFIFGIPLMYVVGMNQGWLHVKITLVIFLSIVHAMLSKHRRQFAYRTNKKSALYFRILNEIPTILMIAIIFLVILKPF